MKPQRSGRVGNSLTPKVLEMLHFGATFFVSLSNSDYHFDSDFDVFSTPSRSNFFIVEYWSDSTSIPMSKTDYVKNLRSSSRLLYHGVHEVSFNHDSQSWCATDEREKL